MKPIKQRGIENEITFKTARSGGAGGQHVNKVSTKVIASFNVAETVLFSEEEKAQITQKLPNRISTEGILSVANETTRSQHRNKALAIDALLTLLEKALYKPKARKATTPSAEAIRTRKQSKKKQSEKKKLRTSGWRSLLRD